eukprot:1150903-Pelagomonas_calceolata.AAC.4
MDSHIQAGQQAGPPPPKHLGFLMMAASAGFGRGRWLLLQEAAVGVLLLLVQEATGDEAAVDVPFG